VRANERPAAVDNEGPLDPAFGDTCVVEFNGLDNRHRWRTRIELANAIFEYLEVFHNRQRRHSSVGMHTPIEYERIHDDNLTIAQSSQVS